MLNEFHIVTDNTKAEDYSTTKNNKIINSRSPYAIMTKSLNIYA